MNDLRLISLRPGTLLSRYALWVVLLLSSGVPRILAAFMLPNEEGDPYSYLRAIEMMRDGIAGGTFTLSELFGFWLPLYQFICALISAIVGHPLYVAKLVSAVCGTGVCLLVFVVSMRLTANRIISLLAFALIALNPIHIMYSAFSLSDVPHALLVISSLYFVIKNRWVIAAGFVAAGGLMRPESWLLIVLLPALQWSLNRRVSLVAFLIGLSAPLVWIYISWAATGDALEYFKVRSDYIKGLLLEDPGLTDFSVMHISANLKTMLYSAGPAVIIAGLIVACLLLKRFLDQRSVLASESSRDCAITAAAYFFSFLGFLLVAYFTKNQPAIFARYCLVLFALGLPILAWVLWVAREWAPSKALGLSLALFALCAWQFAVQLRDAVGYIKHVSQKRIVASYLSERVQSDSNAKVFCDDDTIKALSGIAEDRFVVSSSSPPDSTSFLNYLAAKRVDYVVYEERRGSAAVTLFRELGEERINDLFQLVRSTNTDLRLYRRLF